MRTSKRFIFGLIWGILFIALQVLLCFLLEPYRSSSDEMWEGFHETEDIGVIYTGSSQAMCAVDPELMDAALGTSSYNMATNMQSLHNSKVVIANAIAAKNIDAAILIVDYELLNTSRADNYRAEAGFLLAKCKQEGVLAALGDSANFMLSSDFIGKPISLTYLFPWTYNRATNVRLNVQEKLAGQVLDTEGHRTARGYEPSQETLDDTMVSISLEEAPAWSAEQDLEEPAISAENLQTLQEICALCQENDVRLYVLIPPVWNCFSIYDYDAYMDVGEQLETLCDQYGYVFADFNVDPALDYQARNAWFKDVGHLNSQGAQQFSAYLAQWLQTQQ